MSEIKLAVEELREIVNFFIESFSAGEDMTLLQSLTVGMDPAYVSKFPLGSASGANLLRILFDYVNKNNERFNTGEWPLEILLANAIDYLHPRISAQRVAQIRKDLFSNYSFTKLAELIDDTRFDENTLGKIFKACIQDMRFVLPKFSKRDMVKALLFLAEKNKWEIEGYGVCVFASVVGRKSSNYLEVESWIKDSIKANAWEFSVEDVGLDAEAINEDLQEYEDEYIEVVQVKITVLDTENNSIDAEFYSWSREDKNDIRHDKIRTTLSDLPLDIDDRIETNALVELFLPTDLMNINIEFADEKEESLIVEHRVVRRFADRQKIAKMQKQTIATKRQLRPFKNWQKRWEKFKSGEGLVADLFHPIERSDLNSGNSLANLKITLKNQMEVCCTGCEAYPDTYLDALLQLHIQSGIPIMFWPGVSLKPLNLLDFKNDHFCIKGEFLLEKLRDFQIEYLMASEHNFDKNNLFCIYDDPERMLP